MYPKKKKSAYNTCHAEHNPSVGDPGLLGVMPEVGDDVEGIEGLENGGVVANEVGEADDADEHVPHKDRRGEGVPNLVGAEPLNREH